MTGPEQERQLVRHRLLRLQLRIESALSEDAGENVDLPATATLAIENELISLRREAFIAGKRAGYEAARAVGREIGPRIPPQPPPIPVRAIKGTPRDFPPPALDSRDITPVYPTDWVGPRRVRDDD